MDCGHEFCFQKDATKYRGLNHSCRRVYCGKTFKLKPMLKSTISALFLFIFLAPSFSQTPSKVDYDAFEKLVAEVKDHRADRLITLDQFIKMSQDKDVLILDARSNKMYSAKHVKGAVNLTFADFTQEELANIIPSTQTKILIYCNNNFDEDEEYFPSKMAKMPFVDENKQITLALNIPTYINLYGYGYKNVYELSELISIHDKRLQLEGSEVPVGF